MPTSSLSRLSKIGSLVVSIAICLVLVGANRGAITKPTLNPDAPVVELFEGIDSEQFEARLVAQNAHDGKIFITNKTDKALTVAVPKGLVGVQILAQAPNNQFNQIGMGNGMMNGMNNGMQGQNGAAQSVGGNAGIMGQNGQQNGAQNGNNGINQGNNQFPGGFMFSIPPEKTVQLAFNSVCLNYGRREPHAGMKYKLAKAESVTTDPVLLQLLEDYSPRTARDAQQAAAWHLANGLTWEQIAQLMDEKIPGNPTPYFSAQQIQAAKTLVEKSEKSAVDRPQKVEKKIEIARSVVAK
ncbi:MAG: hypothetical protein JWP89_1597 [Schlesneria sp.]|nr:hypothetical protein [Schlesneria sp.]